MCRQELGGAVPVIQTLEEVEAQVQELAGSVPDEDASEFQVVQGNGSAGPKPELLVPSDGRLDSVFAAELSTILKRHNFFNKDGECHFIDEKTGQIKPVTFTEFVTLIERYCTPIVRKVVERPDGRRTTITVEKSISFKVAHTVLVSLDLVQGLRTLRSFNSLRMPSLDPNGNIVLSKIGYDENTQVYTVNSGPEIDDNVTLEDSVKFLRNLLAEFCFLDDDRERSISVSIAQMLSLFCIDILPRFTLRPGFIFNANDSGSGKTLLAKLGIITRLGYAPVGTPPPDEKEMKKLIATSAYESAEVLFLDNIKHYLNSPSLEALLTSSVYSDRILSKTKGFTKENRITVVVTANNCTFSPDLRRRVMVVDLFLKEAKAEERVIKNPLDDGPILTLRPKILSALWALIKAWRDAGKPAPKQTHPSFESWSSVICGILEHAGFESPCVPTVLNTAGDKDTSDMEKLVLLLVPGAGYSFSELVELARSDDLFARIVPDEELDVKQKSAFGKLLQRFSGRMFYREYRFESTGQSRKTRKFRLTKIEVLEPPIEEELEPPDIEF
jgi:hypothetical protein